MSRLHCKFVSLIGCLILTLGWLSAPTNSAWANQWAPSVGEAKDVQFRTRDIVDRVNRTFPYSPVAHAAMHMDNSASQLVDAVKCGAAWNQVQALLQRTCALAGSTNSLINDDCNVRNDRRIHDYMLDLSKRIERLRCSLEKDFARTQPAFCVPQHQSSYRPPLGVDPRHGVPYAPWSFQYRSAPNSSLRYPHSTYDFDNQPINPMRDPFESLPYPSAPSGTVPHGHGLESDELPPGSQIGPIEYRVQRNAPRSSERAAAFAQLGIEVLRMLSN